MKQLILNKDISSSGFLNEFDNEIEEMIEKYLLENLNQDITNIIFEYLKYKKIILLRLLSAPPKFPFFNLIKMEFRFVNLYQYSHFNNIKTKLIIKKNKNRIINFFNNMILFFKRKYKIDLIIPYNTKKNLEIDLSIPLNSINYNKNVNNNQDYKVIISLYNIKKYLNKYKLNINLYHFEKIKRNI